MTTDAAVTPAAGMINAVSAAAKPKATTGAAVILAEVTAAIDATTDAAAAQPLFTANLRKKAILPPLVRLSATAKRMKTN